MIFRFILIIIILYLLDIKILYKYKTSYFLPYT